MSLDHRLLMWEVLWGKSMERFIGEINGGKSGSFKRLVFLAVVCCEQSSNWRPLGNFDNKTLNGFMCL